MIHSKLSVEKLVCVDASDVAGDTDKEALSVVLSSPLLTCKITGSETWELFSGPCEGLCQLDTVNRNKIQLKLDELNEDKYIIT